MKILFRNTRLFTRVRFAVVYFLIIAVTASSAPIHVFTAYAIVGPETPVNPDTTLGPTINRDSFRGSLLEGTIRLPGVDNISSLNVSADLTNSTNIIYGGGRNGSPYGTSLGGGTGCPGGTPSPGGGCDYGGGSDSPGPGVEGVGGCAAGLLSSIMESIGFSIAGATFGKATSEAGKAAAVAGGTAGLADPTSVPTKDKGDILANIGTAISSLGDSISNFFTAITENKSLGLQEQERVESFMSCIARSIARALIQQVVSSTINWINSGFAGSPAFISNPTEFFKNTADMAAGNFLQSSELAFLCSPFSLQVKIAIAQTYTGANNSGLQCTLTGAVNNLQGFMNNFQNGGWTSFISMTTNPSNQPYGAYMQGTIGLNSAVAAAVQNKQSQLALSGGFLDFQQERNCRTTTIPPSPLPNQSITPVDQVSPTAPGVQTYQVCDLITVTPGKVASDALSKSLGMNLDELNMAKNFDEIISALITQLFQKVLGGRGLLGLGSNYGGSASDFSGGVNAIEALQNNVLANIPVYIQSANTAVAMFQRNIALVQPVLLQATSTLACLQNANGYSGLTAEGQAFVTTNLPVLQSTVNQLSAYLVSYQDQLTRANRALTILDRYQTDAGSASGISNLASLAANFTADIAASTFPDQALLNGADEDYGTLTSQISNVNQTLPGIAQQCQALGVPARTPNTPLPPPPPVPVCSLTFTPATIILGEDTQLTWVSTNATAGTIDQGVGTVGATGSRTITPSAPGVIRYTGTFTGAGGTSPACSTDLTVLVATT